jgi:hypothetical protein
MLGFIWRWLFRPLIVVLTGRGSVDAAEAHPIAGCVVASVAILLAVSLIIDIVKGILEIMAR